MNAIARQSVPDAIATARRVPAFARRGGIALMLVVAVLAVATIMGFVMLSSASLQNRAGANHARITHAEYLAESGINIAMYYLQYPERAPMLNAEGFWSGTTSDLEMGQGHTLAIAVTRDATEDATFEIATTANVGSLADSRVSRSSGARVLLRKQFEVTKAAAFNFDTQISPGTNIAGDVWTNRNLAIRKGTPTPSIVGIGYCKTASLSSMLYLLPTGGFRTANPLAPGSPSVTEISLYKTYKYGNATCNAQILTGGSLSMGTTLAPTPANPAGVYCSDSTLDLSSDVMINGTLVVDGTLNIRGGSIVINPQPGYPALIVTDALDIDRTQKGLTLNGTCFVGTQVRASGTIPDASLLSKLAINGGLLVAQPAAAPIPTSGYNILTAIKYDPALAAPLALKIPRGISVLRWGLP